MPKLSDTMTEGTLVAWKKKKGDKVSAGEILAEIETDKATMEWESPEDGTLTEIYVEEGGKVNVGDRIAFIGAEGEEAPAAETREKEAKPAVQEEGKPKTAEEKAAPARRQKEPAATGVASAAAVATRTPAQAEAGRVKASPVARRIAAELGIDLSSIKGTGPDGRVTAADVRAAAQSKAALSRPSVPAAVQAGES
ncbi:MAG: E3 binding domain-containing protein, partial [Chthoniobacterales bacterium]|nr:E3 binding domain-containing protein [Chthoniobacterales bacterium]